MLGHTPQCTPGSGLFLSFNSGCFKHTWPHSHHRSMLTLPYLKTFLLPFTCDLPPILNCLKKKKGSLYSLTPTALTDWKELSNASFTIFLESL